MIAVEILKIGGVIAYPTETVYGLGANIFNENAVRRIFEIKKRPFGKPISVAVSGFDMIKDIAYLSQKNYKIIRKLLPGPITIILPKKEIVSELIAGDFIGIRFPENDIALEIIDKANFPITATSANVSGEKEVTKPEDINLDVDYIVKGECKYQRPSTVVDLVNMKILRESVGIEKVKNVLNI
ncbi:MAG: threonylcarbamoyl-AMP synthase [Candidatus Aenigmarchaeota archaeon ex4484_56]|nr:MAG: threonylcarbamoyl-AMP synthase [Candidatus Aenigmarchaeota archaeon ex4484_56]